MESPMDGFREATVRCCHRFMADKTHRGGLSPLMNGPCDDCCAEVVEEVRAQFPNLARPEIPVRQTDSSDQPTD